MSDRVNGNGRSGVGGMLLVVLASGAMVGLVLGVWTARLNHLGALDALVLAAHLTGLYTVVSAVFIVPASLLLAVFGYPPTARRALALVTAGYVIINGATRYISSVQLISVTPHMTLVGLLDATVVLTAALAAGGLIAARRSALGVGLAVLLIGCLEIFHQLHEPSRRLDLSRYASGDVAPRPIEVEPAIESERLRETKLAIFGVDGLAWELLIPLMERGAAPNFRALVDGAALGHLSTLFYCRSPALWETISTGRTPFEHGIADHVHHAFPGVGDVVRHFPRFPLANSLMGINRLLVATAPFGPWAKRGSDSTDARAARFWEVASANGTTVGIYNWLNASPAAPVRGFVWGYKDLPPRRFPPDLDAGWTTPPKPVARPGMEWIEGSIAVESAEFAHFLALARQFDPELLAYYTHYGDGANHLNWKREAHGDAIFFPGLRAPALEPGPAMTRAMRLLDEQLGDYLRRLPEDATFMVVSDHGFDFRGYEHDNSPPGVLIVRGPAIRPGLIEDASLYDVAPTVLHILGLPVADDMQRAPLRIAAPGSILDREPTRVATHGTATTPLTGTAPSEDSLREQEEYLKALGYVN
jgi:hypothetical protein